MDFLRLKNFIISAFTGAFTGNAKTEIHMVPYIRISKEHRGDESAKNLTTLDHDDTYYFYSMRLSSVQSFNQRKRCRSCDRAINAFERAVREVNSAAHCSNSINQAAVAAAANLGGECNPASGTEGQSEIGVAFAAAPHDTVGFGSSSDLGGGECAPSANGTGLSEIGAARGGLPRWCCSRSTLR